ncbi:MAG: 1-acyl-sn-glycerol-3-phosphate acyltransferase [Anaerolineae bacterium]
MGILRLAIAFPIIGIGTLLVLAVAWLPMRNQGIRLAPWICTLVARLVMLVFNVRFHCPKPERIRQHRGLVFANHTTYFDILMLLHVLPVRFVSAIEIRSWPLIGWMARAIGAVFVNRSDKPSRAETRKRIAEAERYPPIVLFPEGGIGPANALRPFRFGAFEIAVEYHIPYLPCAILYDRPEVIAWGDESFMRAVWRLACWPGPIHALLIPLPAVTPQPDDDPELLAIAAHRAIADALRVPPQMPASVEHDGLPT